MLASDRIEVDSLNFVLGRGVMENATEKDDDLGRARARHKHRHRTLV